MKTRSFAVAAVAILAVVAIVLTVVGYYGTQPRGPVPTTTATASSAPIPVQSGSTQPYYEQAITWGVCTEGTFEQFEGIDSSDASEYQCAFLKAPLDWSNPDGDQISLALAIHRSGQKDAPVLFVNPGGPAAPSSPRCPTTPPSGWVNPSSRPTTSSPSTRAASAPPPPSSA